jgi:HTH-type transcriptional regulator, sugar sensing transcriptional regulator
MDDLIDKLKQLGLNTYEAKVYLALLRHHPATGYEVSKTSGVPQARAYDTLKALETNKIVVASSGKPVNYTPISSEELLNRWERSFKGSVEYLRDALPSLTVEQVEPVLNLRGEATMFAHAEEMIATAKKSIFLELWKHDATILAPSLKAAKERGVDLKIVGYDDLTFDFCNVYPHGLARTIENSLGGRWVILAVDDIEGMVGTVPVEGKNSGPLALTNVNKPDQPSRPPQAVYTRNPGIVLIIKELIVHDIFLLDVEDKLSVEMERVYGKNLMSLRQKILGDEMMTGAH